MTFYKLCSANFIWNNSVSEQACNEKLIKVIKVANDSWLYAGFPRSVENVEKVLNCEIGFQDLEKVLNLGKMYVKYWKSMEISKFSRLVIQILCFAVDDSFTNVFTLCSMNKIL